MPPSSRSLKVVVIGDADTGKTALRARYLTRAFQPAYRATIGADFVARTVEVTVPVPGHEHRQSQSNGTIDKKKAAKLAAEQDVASTSAAVVAEDDADDADDYTRSRTERMRITMSIWDTAGQERFKSLGSAFYRGADGVIIAFDVTKRGALERTLTWYRDFCALGDLGLEEEDEVLARSNPRQAREARERRQRFCWVAVGCKGDLLAELTQQSPRVNGTAKPNVEDDDSHEGTKWSDTRAFFDKTLPRYVPPFCTEENAFQDVEKHLQATTAKPYDIDVQPPARPEDVLSRPSPQNTTAGPSNPTAECSRPIDERGGRHPDAGTPPGEAAGILASAEAQPPTPSRLRVSSKGKGRSGRRSVDVWQPEKSTDSYAPTFHSFQRSRYDSATSLGAPSVYYSVKSDNRILHSGSNRDGLPSVGSSATAHATEPSSEEASVENDKTEVDSNEDRDLKVTRRKMGRSDTGQSSRTIRQQAHEQTLGASVKTDKADDSPAVVSIVPSGDPIPFPSEEDDLGEASAYGQDAGALHRRYKRLSRKSMPRAKSRHEDLIGRRSRNVSQIAAVVKEDQEEQAHDRGNNASKRATLYSAPPSECASTIRGADEDLTTNEISITRADEHNDTAVTEQAHANADISSSPPSSLHDSEYEADEGEMFEAAHVERGFRLFYTSAKNDIGIDDVFDHIARRVAINWAYDEWDEARRRRMWGHAPDGAVRTAPPADEERERERMRRAIRISTGKGTGDCCW